MIKYVCDMCGKEIRPGKALARVVLQTDDYKETYHLHIVGCFDRVQRYMKTCNALDLLSKDESNSNTETSETNMVEEEQKSVEEDSGVAQPNPPPSMAEVKPAGSNGVVRPITETYTCHGLTWNIYEYIQYRHSTKDLRDVQCIVAACYMQGLSKAATACDVCYSTVQQIYSRWKQPALAELYSLEDYPKYITGSGELVDWKKVLSLSVANWADKNIAGELGIEIFQVERIRALYTGLTQTK